MLVLVYGAQPQPPRFDSRGRGGLKRRLRRWVRSRRGLSACCLRPGLAPGGGDAAGVCAVNMCCSAGQGLPGTQ